MQEAWLKRYSAFMNQTKRGLTLVEVLAATALIGTVLTGVLVSQARIKRQNQSTEIRTDAIQALDSLIAEWWVNNPAQIPLNTQGITDDERWRWETREQTLSVPDPIQARLVRISINRRGHTSHRVMDALASVEIIVPYPTPPNEEGGQDG